MFGRAAIRYAISSITWLSFDYSHYSNASIPISFAFSKVTRLRWKQKYAPLHSWVIAFPLCRRGRQRRRERRWKLLSKKKKINSFECARRKQKILVINSWLDQKTHSGKMPSNWNKVKKKRKERFFFSSIFERVLPFWFSSTNADIRLQNASL